MRWLLSLFGLRIIYECEWGTYDERYDSLDRQMMRPVHPDMSVAPPWAKRKIVRKEWTRRDGRYLPCIMVTMWVAWACLIVSMLNQ